MAQQHTPGPDWYERRDELFPRQIFRTHDDQIIRLDRRVPGDGTDWYADVWCGNHFSCEDCRLHPADLRDRLSDDWPGKAEPAQ